MVVRCVPLRTSIPRHTLAPCIPHPTFVPPSVRTISLVSLLRGDGRPFPLFCDPMILLSVPLRW